MVCLPQAGFVAKYGEKLTTLGGILGYWPPQERSCCSCQESRTGLLCAFSLLEIIWEGRVWRERGEEWGFLDQAGMIWRFQPNNKIAARINLKEEGLGSWLGGGGI